MTAFEIRLKLLEIARDILNEKAWATRAAADNDWAAAKDYADTKGEKAPNAPVTEMPTIENVILEAQKLNTFVSKN